MRLVLSATNAVRLIAVLSLFKQTTTKQKPLHSLVVCSSFHFDGITTILSGSLRTPLESLFYVKVTLLHLDLDGRTLTLPSVGFSMSLKAFPRLSKPNGVEHGHLHTPPLS